MIDEISWSGVPVMLRRCYNVVSLRVRKWKVIDNKWDKDKAVGRRSPSARPNTGSLRPSWQNLNGSHLTENII